LLRSGAGKTERYPTDGMNIWVMPHAITRFT